MEDINTILGRLREYSRRSRLPKTSDGSGRRVIDNANCFTHDCVDMYEEMSDLFDTLDAHVRSGLLPTDWVPKYDDTGDVGEEFSILCHSDPKEALRSVVNWSKWCLKHVNDPDLIGQGFSQMVVTLGRLVHLYRVDQNEGFVLTKRL